MELDQNTVLIGMFVLMFAGILAGIHLGFAFGITALIGPMGGVVAELPQFEPGVLRGGVVARSGSTPYIVWGDSAVLALALLAFAAYWVRTKLTMRPGT